MNIQPDFNRNVHCILGLPFDATSISETVEHVKKAAANSSNLFLSTPNLNFLISAQKDLTFRNSVVNSDLSVPDGMPIVWIARLLSVPIKERVAGSDLFEKLRSSHSTRLSVYFFGGKRGVAEAACRVLNNGQDGLYCAGYIDPGFTSIEEMSSLNYIKQINASGADFLVVSLGAQKGQAWIENNRRHISVPVISHLGAVVNFTAGNLDRAPVWIRRCGLEWLWRIKEEPELWRRYAHDGLNLAALLLTKVLPYSIWQLNHDLLNRNVNSGTIHYSTGNQISVVQLDGVWRQQHLHRIRACFSSIAGLNQEIMIDMQNVTWFDSAFVGLLTLLYSHQLKSGNRFRVIPPKNSCRRIFYYMCADYLLAQ